VNPETPLSLTPAAAVQMATRGLPTPTPPTVPLSVCARASGRVSGLALWACGQVQIANFRERVNLHGLRLRCEAALGRIDAEVAPAKVRADRRPTPTSSITEDVGAAPPSPPLADVRSETRACVSPGRRLLSPAVTWPSTGDARCCPERERTRAASASPSAPSVAARVLSNGARWAA